METDTSNNSNLFNEITYCTIKVLNLLVRLYEHKKISHAEFKSNVNIKISFLKANLDYVEDKDIRADIQKLMDRCVSILDHSH